jgi:serine/threonine-protein kinase
VLPPVFGVILPVAPPVLTPIVSSLVSPHAPMQPANPLLGQPQPGDVILGKYRVERVIGLGGMGAVVSARHLQLDERVAIKFLLPAMLSNEEVVQRFLREAKAAIRIRSEHCVRVLDVGTLETGAPYMVMEFLEGRDLAAIGDSQPVLPIPDVIDWVLQASEALAEAHALGIVHRDLKPANLFLTRRADGTPSVKVLDFGISKQAASGADAGVTKTQAVLGSPRYMSPEQMRSTKDVDARADVWALGAVIHELVSGRPPFDADTMTALCAAILQDPPRPMRDSRPDIPPQLEAVVLGALEKDRNRRFANVAQLAAALAPFGSPSARASAERIARVLGVPTGLPMVTSGAGFVTGSSPGFGSPQPMAGTTGGSSVATAMRGTGPSGGAIAAAVVALVVFAVGGTVGLVAWTRHAAAPAPATATSAPQGGVIATAQPSAMPSVTVVLAEPSATSSSSAAAPAAAGPAPTATTAPAASGHRPPAGVPRPAVTPGPTKPPANGNPFGDDRRG